MEATVRRAIAEAARAEEPSMHHNAAEGYWQVPYSV
jgi:hypothetical protein